MSIQIDINTIGDLVALYGTEGDRRAWPRIRAELDRARDELAAARAELAVLREEMRKWTEMQLAREAAAREPMRPAAIVLVGGEFHAFGDVRQSLRFADGCPGSRWFGALVPDGEPLEIVWHPSGDRPAPEACRLSCARAVPGRGGS